MNNENPLDALSSLERERRFGVYKDLNEEQKQFAKDYGEEERREAIFNLVSDILRRYEQTGTMPNVPVLVCAEKWKREAWFVASHFKIKLNAHPCFPENKFFVTEGDKVSKLITSQNPFGPYGLFGRRS